MINRIEDLILPILKIYDRIELDLLLDIAKRFKTYDEVKGILEWRIEKLIELGAFNQQALKIISKYSGKTEKEIRKMIKKASIANFDIDDLKKAKGRGLISEDIDKALDSVQISRMAENTFSEVSDVFKMINTGALESASQRYMDVLNQAFTEVESGAYSYTEAIGRAIQKMARSGITGATYQRQMPSGETKLVNYTLEGVVRRDVVTAVNKLANDSVFEEYQRVGYEYVEISQHLGARTATKWSKNPKWANHFGWQGKVYKINGSDEYGNLVEETGYGDIEGLGGVNCRHRMYPFIPGVTIPKAQKWSEEENRKHVELEKKQRALERNLRTLRRQYECLREIGDKDRMKALKARILAKSEELDNFCKDNDLKRDFSREVVR